MRGCMKWTVGIVIAMLSFAISSNGAQGQTLFDTDSDGVPRRAHLSIETCDPGDGCKSTCNIVAKADRSQMSCDAWLSRYCPASLDNPRCKVFRDEVNYAKNRLAPPPTDPDGVPRARYLTIKTC